MGLSMKLLDNVVKLKFLVLTLIGLTGIYLVLDTIVYFILYGIFKLDPEGPAFIARWLNMLIAAVISVFIGWKLSQKSPWTIPGKYRGTWAE